MMDSAMISSILNVIEKSDISDLNLLQVEERPISIEKGEDGSDINECHICVCDAFGCSESPLSQAWVAGNILLFTVFDGYLENKYNLTEGASLKNHYDHLPSGTMIERDCYRVLKLIRNGIQHNLSKVVVNQGAYAISYLFRNTSYELHISKKGMSLLYTMVLNLINNRISGLYTRYSTAGHYNGIMNSMYEEMCQEITLLSDDISDPFRSGSIFRYDSAHLRHVVRYPVENPHVLSETDSYVEHVGDRHC